VHRAELLQLDPGGRAAFVADRLDLDPGGQHRADSLRQAKRDCRERNAGAP